MTHNSEHISSLRQRMIENMALRKLAPKTQSNYHRAVINFTCFLGQSPFLQSYSSASWRA